MKKFINILVGLGLCLVVGLNGGTKGKVSKASKDVPVRDWAFLVYMVPNGNLDQWAEKNMAAMQLGCTGSNVTVCVHRQDDMQMGKRYVIQNSAVTRVPGKAFAGDLGQDVVQAMQWMVNNYPATNYGLIWWGNGFGILEPSYNATINDWVAEADPGTPKACINGSCPLPEPAKILKHLKLATRGLLFHNATQSYITNQLMSQALAGIQTNVLGGNKLGILGMDCCKGAMVEIAYAARNYANVLIGSENCELADGWNYADAFMRLSADSAKTPNQAATIIAGAYKDYYEANTEKNTYTLSAINLPKIDGLVESLNELTNFCIDAAKVYPAIADAITAARGSSINMCDMPSYTDLGAFLKQFGAEVDARASSIDFAVATAIQSALINILAKVGRCIISNITGSNIVGARGMSIYFPFSHIDSSYPTTSFAQETAWLNFVQTFYHPVSA